jgi:hypothetical protein
MHLSTRSKIGLFFSLVTLFSIAGAFLLNAAFQPHATHAANANPNWTNTFKFNLVPSAGITSCLPKAQGDATITRGKLNDTMMVEVHGLAPSTGYDLFVIELPSKPFGVSWYQSDLETDVHGNGQVTVRGIFNVETFSISPGDSSNIVFPATHQYHLGLWFNDPTVPFNLGCEPGATSPIVTPFNGEQNAGIQVLNTSNFPVTAGPLSHVAP